MDPKDRIIKGLRSSIIFLVHVSTVQKDDCVSGFRLSSLGSI